MKHILKDIEAAKANGTPLLAVLIDPDKFKLEHLELFVTKAHQTIITHFFVGGSTVEAQVTQKLVNALKRKTSLPIVLFPGDVTQISDQADAILFLSLLSVQRTSPWNIFPGIFNLGKCSKRADIFECKGPPPKCSSTSDCVKQGRRIDL